MTPARIPSHTARAAQDTCRDGGNRQRGGGGRGRSFLQIVDNHGGEQVDENECLQDDEDHEVHNQHIRLLIAPLAHLRGVIERVSTQVSPVRTRGVSTRVPSPSANALAHASTTAIPVENYGY